MYRLKNRACSRVEARSQGRASTGDEAVANAAYELLQRWRRHLDAMQSRF